MNGECRHGTQKKICWHCSEKNNDVSKSISNGGLDALRVDEEKAENKGGASDSLERGVMPQRVQRKRTRGWRMPPNTIYVGRPTKYGNPIAGEYSSDEYRRYMRARLFFRPDFLKLIKGKNLACWCPLDKPCHADVLLKMANGA